MRKGFTLVELLAVIVIIAITSMIVFPTIGDVITDAKKDLYDEQILDIQAASEKWATDNMDLLDKSHLNEIYISLDDLKLSGYLEKDEIINPLTKETMNGCIQIKYNFDNKKYSYVYNEKTCNKENIESLGSVGYIIYTYNTKTKIFEQSVDSNILNTAGLSIYNYYVEKNLIKADGEVLNESGSLYEMEDEYVFRGINPNNYVTFEGKTWRILSISKKDYSIKLIEATSSFGTKQWDEQGGINVVSSTFVQALIDSSDTSNKIVNSDFNISTVDGTNYSVRTLASSMINTTSLKIGTISILDYVNASATLECPSNYMSESCKNNNYLYSMFGTTNSTWTINTNGAQAWYIDTDGLLKVEATDRSKQIYKVVRLNTNVYLEDENAVGSESYKYVIK